MQSKRDDVPYQEKSMAHVTSSHLGLNMITICAIALTDEFKDNNVYLYLYVSRFDCSMLRMIIKFRVHAVYGAKPLVTTTFVQLK